MDNAVIRVNMKTGTDEWLPNEWDDYSYEGAIFVVKREGNWVGIYNMDNVLSITVEEDEDSLYD